MRSQPSRGSGVQFMQALPPALFLLQPANPFMIQQSPSVTASFGVTSIIPTEFQPPELILVQADHALYQAKNEDRDRIVKV
jgi:GGDEF domain-containing protein